MEHASTHLFIFFGIIVLLPFLYPVFLVKFKGVDGSIANRNVKVFAVAFGVLVVLTLALSTIHSSLQ
jgi:cytochrome c biogenesis factor